MRLRLRSRWVLGFREGDHVLLENAEVVLRSGVVEHVGAASNVPCERTRDCGEALIAPGFIDLNALADADGTILGYDAPPVGGRSRTLWSRDYATRRAHDVLSLDEQVRAARAAFAQLLLSGITTALPVTSLLHRAWAETAAEFERVAELSDELGIRLVLGPSFRSAVNVVEADGTVGQVEDEARGRAGLRDAAAFAERVGARRYPLISALLVPSTIDTCSDALIWETAAAAEDLGVPYRLHCCQSLLEAETIRRRSGRTSIGHLRSLGVLSPRALLPHAVHLGGPDADPGLIEEDVAAFAETGAVVVHCPLVVGRSGRRLERMGELTARGVSIGLGTDTAPPDMLMNLQIGVALARTETSGPAFGPADYLRAATLGGAAALGRPELGRLEPGTAADVVVWDLSDLSARPVHDPVQALFLMPPGRRAREVFVAGRQVVRDFHVVGVDEDALASDLQGIFETLRRTYRDRDREGRDWRSLFPSTFPIHAVEPAVRPTHRERTE